MKEMRFTPSVLSVVAGRYTVVARNAGRLTHTFSLNELGQEITVTPDKTGTFEVDLAPGTYRYVCRILDHEGFGMRGVLKVRSKQ